MRRRCSMCSRLGIRSSFSLLWGTCAPKGIMEFLASEGCTTLAITDRDNMYGLHEIREEAFDHRMRVVIGSELTTPDGSIFVFVKHPTGYSRLCTILSHKRCTVGFDVVDALGRDSEGLVLAASMPQMLVSLAHYGSELYAAISPHWFGSIPLARQLGIPLMAIDDATFLASGDHEVHKVLRSIHLKKNMGMLGEDEVEPAEHRILTTQHYMQALSSWPEALRNTEHIADACADISLFESFVFPSYPDAKVQLRKRVLVGAEKRYGELSDAILERIGYELDIINRKGFAPYFLVMDDIVAMASRTCGRGSAAASIVSYALGITNVDPIAHNLYFERFLTLSRSDPPDIDVDFAWDERDAILHAVIERFGKDNCARVANHNRFRFRSALRETARAYGISDADTTRMERRLFESGLEGIDDPLWHTVCALASRMEGMPRGLSMHCGGMVITPRQIGTYAPVEYSREGYPLLAWEKEGTESARLVKIDLLGNRSLAVIRDTLANLREEGVSIDERTWHPAEDRPTVEALAIGDSIGVFYIESPAMRQLQKKTGRGDFAHIVIHSSIIRPAANAYINEYVRRLKGGAWEPLHPLLEKILDETYGILCYQEDVSKVAMALAGFDEADADALRKVISKKSGGQKLERYRLQFFSGCCSHGVEEQTVERIWEMMLSFDGYSFCKPHSASYAMVSFQSAYLRVHHPAPFMAAVLTNQGGYYRPQAYISEARRMGLQVEGPDINRSRWGYFGQGCTVVVGFMAIANLSKAAVSTILSERERHGFFTSLEEASSRLSLGREDLVSLVAAGTCDSLAPALPRSEQLRTMLLSRRNTSEQGQLFAMEEPLSSIPLPVPGKVRGEAELLREFESLGFLRDHHPLMLWARRIMAIPRIRAIDLSVHVGKRVSVIGWPITRKTVWTKNGLPMDFISFEDETALYETIFFPQVHEAYRKLLYGQRPLVIRAMVRDDDGALYLEVASISVI